MTEPAKQRAFWSALGKNDCAQLRELAAEGADVNQAISNSGGETPLIRAIAAGDVGLVRLLLELGADVNLPCAEGKSWTPLMFAVDNPELLCELLAAGADVNARSRSDLSGGPFGGLALRVGGETALHLAAAVGNVESVKTLLQAGAEVEARAGDGSAPLDYAIRQGSITKAAEALVAAGADLTPKRLELMHAAAHRPDSDVLTFSTAAESAAISPGKQATTMTSQAALLGRRSESEPPPEEWRCPACHALIYSLKSKVCGQCGALLPPELVLTAQQSAALHEQRRWARDLADKFDGLAPALRVRPSSGPAKPGPSGEPAQRFSPQELLRHVSCVDDFRRRARPTFWLYVGAYGFLFGLCGLLAVQVNVLSPGVLLLTISLFVLACALAWHRTSPICPNCRQNIRYCAAGFCHVCGAPLRYGRCSECGVDESWKGFLLRRSRLRGNYRWIKFCPGCGVELGSKVVRWLAD